jgi:hypothetical protein
LKLNFSSWPAPTTTPDKSSFATASELFESSEEEEEEEAVIVNEVLEL